MRNNGAVSLHWKKKHKQQLKNVSCVCLSRQGKAVSSGVAVETSSQQNLSSSDLSPSLLLSLWNLWISPEFWNGLVKSFLKSLFSRGRLHFSGRVWLIKTEKKTVGGGWCSHLSWEVKVHTSKPPPPPLRRLTFREYVSVFVCVRASLSLSLRRMAATWRRSWSGPEGGWGKQWWRSRAAGGRSCPPPGRPLGSAAHRCSYGHTEMKRRCSDFRHQVTLVVQ